MSNIMSMAISRPKMALLGLMCVIGTVAFLTFTQILTDSRTPSAKLSHHIVMDYSMKENHKKTRVSNNRVVQVQDYWELMEKKMNNRRKLIESSCKEIHHNNKRPIHPLMFTNIVVNDKLKILYCKVPKVACSNWLKVLYIMSAEPNNITSIDQIETKFVHEKDTTKKYFPTLDMYSKPEIEYRLHNYLKFAFVRNPFERIFSAYMNKFVNIRNDYFRRKYGTEVYDLIDEDVPLEDRLSGENVTFRQFAKYLVHPRVKRPFNEHWQQYSELCRPCAIQYDIVGKYETMDTDMKYTLKRMGVEEKLNYTGHRYSFSSTQEQMGAAYKTIPIEDLKKLMHLYILDFTLFGYNSPIW
ncbi:unnamed protein product [Owenia fusiformis]|uniref:Carbohydrate sulfotransferase n=1 Tax=Owenia fusiformis TaxID=6347 RepID=A0A8J1XFZ8_OWEFU|nr:unnamed protein product [Owenia fusiformis]